MTWQPSEMSKPGCTLVKAPVSLTCSAKRSSDIDWTLCCICQNDNDTALTCPGESKRKDAGAGYTTLAFHLESFEAVGELPLCLQSICVAGGQDLLSAFIENKARFHKSCRDNFNSTKLNRLLKRQLSTKNDEYDEQDTETKRTRSTLNARHEMKEIRCIICEEAATIAELCSAKTLGLDSHVRECATLLNDSKLLAKLSVGDVVAIEAKYHKRCLVGIYNKVRSLKRHKKFVIDNSCNDHKISSVFAELVSFINDRKDHEEESPVFRLKDLCTLYSERLEMLGVKDYKVNSTRLKEKICAHIPHLEAYTQGKYILMAFKNDIGQVLADAFKDHTDEDALCLARAAEIVRRDVFSHDNSFNGSFDSNCEERSVPGSLLTLVKMILEGPSIQSQTEASSSNPALAISQLIKYNSVKHSRKKGKTFVRHKASMETPLPIYIGIMVYGKTRKKTVVNKLFDLGVSIPYDRVIQLTNDIGSTVCKFYEQNDVVCPPQLHKGVFTTAAVDNIDHNSSSSTSSGSFHGTAISLFQHPVIGFATTPIADSCNLSERHSLGCPQLPTWYTAVPPDASCTKQQPLSCSAVSLQRTDLVIPRAIMTEYKWLDAVDSAFTNSSTEPISWVAYHANTTPPPNPQCLTSLLPLFPDPSHSTAMIKHTMDIVKRAIAFVNPGQTPVLACDQPLFALAKEIQWTWPNEYGEHQFVLMFGGLHIEMAALKTAGLWLTNSGWCEALVHSGLASQGIADSFLHASHVKRARYAHQVFCAALYLMQRKSFAIYCSAQQNEPLDFAKWCESRCQNSVQFKYWAVTLELELTILIFVRAIRQRDFDLYIDTLDALLPWFFALDRTNYSRWLSIHVTDMKSLPVANPTAAAAFRSGNFTVQKSSRKFSSIAIDHAHEQNNKWLKGDGGVIGLTDSPATLNRWMLAGPEMIRVLSEFEAVRGLTKADKTSHHEQSVTSQNRFKKHVEALVISLEELGNPFNDDGDDLVSLGTKDIADLTVQHTVQNIQQIGINQYLEFMNERIVTHKKPINDVIHRNKLPLFSSRRSTGIGNKIAAVKNDARLFSRLYISCQTRTGSMDVFFSHENQLHPPSLSDANGCIRHGTKSEIISCLENGIGVATVAPGVSAVILDGAAVVQMLRPRESKTFIEYCQKVFKPYVTSYHDKCKRIDVVWDEYHESSLKQQTRNLRGKGIRRRVLPDVAIPSNWQSFLRVDDNKRELFTLLSNCVIQYTEMDVIATIGENVICSRAQDCTMLMPCLHEEADTRIMVHCRDAVCKGHQSILIRTVDSDVVAIAVSSFEQISADELWVAIGTGQKLRYIPIHEIVTSLGPRKARCVAVFHAFTGCDTVSSFAGHGKKRAWETWKSFPEVMSAFLQITSAPFNMSDECMKLLERYVVLLYDRTSNLSKVV